MITKKPILTMVIVMTALTMSFAQISIATLQHGDSTQVFYGQNSFVEAYSASENGDTLNLSAGYFNPPAEIAKGITIIGSGHFPDPTGVIEKRTNVSGLTITDGADSLKLEGLYIVGEIHYDHSSINYVDVIRCRLELVSFLSSSLLESKNHCSFEECFIKRGISFGSYGDDLLIRHCVFFGSHGSSLYGAVTNVPENALIDGNVFLHNLSPFYQVHRSVIQNNIIYGKTDYFNFQTYLTENCIYNNIFLEDQICFGTNSTRGNYIGVAQTDIFVYPIGYFDSDSTINYTHDYHLKNPDIYLGTDGTQVGIYGGDLPFKEEGRPSNPQIISKSIATETDANGNLNISFTVQAQEN